MSDDLFGGGFGDDNFGDSSFGMDSDGLGGQDWSGLDEEERLDYLKDDLAQMRGQGMDVPDYKLEFGAVGEDGAMIFGADNTVFVDPARLAEAESPDVYRDSFVEGIDVSDEHDPYPYGQPDQDNVASQGGDVSFGSLAQCEASCSIEPSEPESYMYKVYQ